MTKIEQDAPHPYAFDRPRVWNDVTGGPYGDSSDWGTIFLGPLMDGGLRFTGLSIDVGPTAATHALKPVPGIVVPYASLDDIAKRLVPPGYPIVRETTRGIDGRPARELTFDHLFVTGHHLEATPENSVRCRDSLVFFEDRGYYYVLRYSTRDGEHDRYAEVFERMISSFHFLD